MVDGGQPPGQGGAASAGGGEEGGDQFRPGRQRYHPALGAVVLEMRPVASVEPQRLGGGLEFDGTRSGGRLRHRAVCHCMHLPSSFNP